MSTTVKRRDSLVFYRSFYDCARELEPSLQAEIYNAIFEYALNGAEPKITGTSKSIFALIRPIIDANNVRYVNGKKGGRPKKSKPKQNQTETENEPNVDVEEDVDVDAVGRETEKENICTEDITDAYTAERAQMFLVRKHIGETLKINFYRDLFSENEQFADRLKYLEEYADILASADNDRKVKALLKLDEAQSNKIFNALRYNNVGNKYNYVWAAVFDCAKTKEGRNETNTSAD